MHRQRKNSPAVACCRCHRDGDVDYFCQKNLCLPSGYDVSQAVRIAEAIDDDDEHSYVFNEEEEEGENQVIQEP